jgi:DNA polymerase III epsilon subunit-like protein
MRVLVFDTETSGLPPKRFHNNVTEQNVNMWPHTAQFSYVVYNTYTDSVETLEDTIVKVPKHIVLNGDSEKIHGITNEMSAHQGVDIEVVLRKFIRHLESVDQVVGHNIEFDLNMVRAECYRLMCNVERAHHFKDDYLAFLSKLSTTPCYCTMQANVERCNIVAVSPKGKTYVKWPTLQELHVELFHCVPSNLHNSLVDVIVCLRCYCKILRDVDVASTCIIVKKILDQDASSASV